MSTSTLLCSCAWIFSSLYRYMFPRTLTSRWSFRVQSLKMFHLQPQNHPTNIIFQNLHCFFLGGWVPNMSCFFYGFPNGFTSNFGPQSLRSPPSSGALQRRSFRRMSRKDLVQRVESINRWKKRTKHMDPRTYSPWVLTYGGFPKIGVFPPNHPF